MPARLPSGLLMKGRPPRSVRGDRRPASPGVSISFPPSRVTAPASKNARGPGLVPCIMKPQLFNSVRGMQCLYFMSEGPNSSSNCSTLRNKSSGYPRQNSKPAHGNRVGSRRIIEARYCPQRQHAGVYPHPAVRVDPTFRKRDVSVSSNLIGFGTQKSRRSYGRRKHSFMVKNSRRGAATRD